MTKGKYVGPVEQLKGKTARLRPSDKEGMVEAQFDDVGERRADELTGCRDVSDLERLMFGWHEFPSDAFRIRATKGFRGSAKAPPME